MSFAKGMGLFVLLSVMILPRPAYAWGDAIPAAILKEAMEKVTMNIQGVILGNLKLLAVQVMNTQLEQLIGGVNGSGLLFISDWRQYLYTVPAEQNQLFVNDFLSQTTRGKCSSMNFESVSRGTFNSNYFTYLCNSARSSVRSPLFVVNIDEYASDPIRSLREGDWRVFNALVANPANNPFGYSLMVEEAQQRDLAARLEIARTEGIANQGYNSVKAGGVVVTPGRTVADLVQNVKTLGNNVLINATNPSEFLGGLVTSIANRAINQMLQRGFEKARVSIQRELGNVNQQIFRTSQQVNQTLGPASQYLQGVNQQLGNVNATLNRSGGAPPSCVGNPVSGC